MKILSLIIALFFAGAISAQDCKYEIDELDAFTKVRITMSKPERLAATSKNEVYIKTSFKDNVYSIFIEPVTGEQFAINEGEDLLIMFADDSVVNLKATETVAVEKPVERTKTYREFVNYTVDPEIWEMLKSKPVKKIRINARGAKYDFDVLSAKGNLFGVLIKCVEK